MFRSTKETADKWPGPDNSKNEYIEDETYSCDRCSDGEWFSETEVEVHKLKMHKRQMLYLVHQNIDGLCKMCLKEFPSNEELYKHIRTDHLLSSEDAIRVEREIFICNECQTIFFNKQHLAIHYAYRHDKIRDSTKVCCPRCQKNIKINTLWFHFQLHSFQSVASCKICYLKCKNRRHLKEHVKTHTKHLVCGICQYETKKEELFNKHILTRHRSIPSSFGYRIAPFFIPKREECKLLKISCFEGLSLMNNVRICVLCREICYNISEMQDHIREHLVTVKHERVVYQCKCGESFSNKVLLKHHIFKLKGAHKEA